MAERVLSPPPIREAVTFRDSLVLTPTWVRWLELLRQQAASGTPGPAGPQGPQGPPGPQGPAGPALGAGAANKVGYWLNASTMTYDSLLHYDPTQHWLGIGTATPTAPLTFANTLGRKINLYSADVYHYGLEVQNGEFRVFADSGAQIRLGTMGGDNTTFTPRFDVLPTYTYSSVPMGVMWGTVAGYELTTNRLYVAGTSYIAQLGVQVVSDASYAIMTNGIHCNTYSRFEALTHHIGGLESWGNTMMNNLRLGDHVAPSYILDVNGSAVFRAGLSSYNNTIVSGGYLQVTESKLYTDGRYGIEAQNYNSNASAYWAYGLAGSPNVAQIRLVFLHIMGQWIGMRMESDSAGNTIDFHTYASGAYMTAGSWVDAPSDRRIKRSIQPIDTPLERLAKLHGAHYERTDLKALEGFLAPNPYEYGLIAQDVAEALPDAAFEHDYGPERGTLWNYYDRPILALLVESVKALAQRVKTLEGA